MSPDRYPDTRWGRFQRWWHLHPIFFVVCIVLFCTGVPLVVTITANNHRISDAEAADRRFIDFQVRNKVDGCNASNRGRKALQQVLDRAAHPPQTGAATIDFSKVPGFKELDPTTQFFLNNLEEALNHPGSNSNLQDIANDYRKSNPSNVDCEKAGRALRKELKG